MSDLFKTLIDAHAHMKTIEWREKVRDADEVEIKLSEYVPRGEVFAIDDVSLMPTLDDLYGPITSRPTGKVYVICHPDHEQVARECVAALRPEAL